MALRLRKATTQDIDSIGELLQFARDESPLYFRTGYSELRVKSTLYNLMQNPTMLHIVSVDEDDKVQGYLMGDIQPDWFGLGSVAVTHIVYARSGKGGLGLIKYFVDWAKGWKKVKKIHIPISFGGERAERTGQLLERLGFENVGSQYMEIL